MSTYDGFKKVIKLPNYDELAEKAIRGDKEALPALAEAVYGSLHNYVFRITLSEDIVEDIVQETILEMYKIFGQLRKGDRFWPWLCKIALNKIRLHSRTQTRQRHLLQKHAEELTARHGNLEGLTNLINDEIKQTVFHAILSLNDHQKAVLSMRCYEDMSYPQIAQVMGMSELGVRLLFFRAKNNLQKYLAKAGLGKKSLIMALVLFGKMTATNEAAAAQVSVASSSLGVGTAATIIGAATTKTVLVLTACGLITVGAVTHEYLNDSSSQSPTVGQQTAVALDDYSKPAVYNLEGYYYYPLGSEGPVMMRLSMSAKDKTCQALQNDTGNYIITNEIPSVVFRNARCWNPDLSVMLVPTDSPEMETFIAAIENRRPIARKSFSTSRELLIAATRHENKDNISFTLQNYDALMEERFQYNWTGQSTVLDQRDALHRQGWCYFTMTGNIKDQRISGLGQIPFLYGISRTKPAWLAVKIGDKVELYDSAQGAVKKESSGTAAAYRQNSFFTGLNKPWMGFHCIDSVRRDAALCDIPFQTELLTTADKSKVSLTYAGGTIEYILDMNQDWIEKITFLDISGNPCGEILFAYFEKMPAGHGEITFPIASQNSESSSRQPVNWLIELASGNL